MRARRRFLSLILLLTLAFSPWNESRASECDGHEDVLGTSRTLMVGPDTPRVGRREFPSTLPLRDKEVVLTFDDGPWPLTTSRILDALKRECVKATFFMVGEMAARAPELARRIVAEGHTVGFHSNRHPLLTRMQPAAALAEIDRGMAAVSLAAYGAAGKEPKPPFFRFPGFASTPELLGQMAERGTIVFGADLWASDWNRMTPAQELRLVMTRLGETGSGILLLHDTKRSTAAMLPELLRQMRLHDYRVVQVVPAMTRP